MYSYDLGWAIDSLHDHDMLDGGPVLLDNRHSVVAGGGDGEGGEGDTLWLPMEHGPRVCMVSAGDAVNLAQ
jgi:hypothetical protein